MEVQVLVTSDYLLTLHDERVSLPAVPRSDLPRGRSKGYVVYSVLDAILATTSDALDEVELRLDSLVAAWQGRGAAEACRGRRCGKPVPGSRR